MRKNLFKVLLSVMLLLCLLVGVGCAEKPVSISLNKTTVELGVGEEEVLIATVKNGGDVSWLSSATTVVSVDTNGKITALAVGTATITATESKENKQATCEITVVKKVESVTLDKEELTLRIGDSTSLTATVNPSDATEKGVTWSSSNSGVVSVNANGGLTAVSVGTATITVTTAEGGKSASCAVTVTDIPELTFDKKAVTLGVGESATIACQLDGAAIANDQLAWSSAQAGVATVENGVVTAVAVGTTTITAKTADNKSVCACEVTVVKKVESVALDQAEMRVVKGAQATLTATITPSDATNTNVIWTSSDERIATVEKGVITAKTCGEVTITVTTEDGEKTATCLVTVYQPVTGISLSVPSVSMKVGDTYQLSATVMPLDATNKTVIWSANSDCISVDETGLVKGLSKGEAVVTAKTQDGEKEITCTVTVMQPVTGVKLNKENDYLAIGGNLTLTASVLPEGANNQNVTWKTDDAAIATVEGGVVTGVAVGTTFITVTTEDGGFTAECTVTVLEINMPAYMAVGQSIEQSSQFEYALASGTAVALKDGKISAVAAGTAVVKASAGSFSQDFTVKVIDFGNTTGSTFDLASDTSLWQYRNYSKDTDVTITYEKNVGDGRETPYTFNALKYARPQNNGEYRALTGNMVYLTPEIITLAKSVGYQFITFTVLVKDDSGKDAASTVAIYNVNADGSLMYVKSKSDPLYSQVIGANWKRYSISLSSEKIFEGAGLGFGMYGKELYITKVEFSGADISEYAKKFFVESTTAGKSMDIVSEDLMGKMFTKVSNTATLTYATGGEKETALGGNDYFKLSKGGYLSKEYFTYNQLRIEADWIQAAKKLGWKTIAIYVLSSSFGNCGTISYLKVGSDGKCYEANTKNSGRWSGTVSTTHSFVSIDISGFEAGESLVLACSGAEIAVSGVTLRTTAGSLNYFNYSANIA